MTPIIFRAPKGAAACTSPAGGAEIDKRKDHDPEAAAIAQLAVAARLRHPPMSRSVFTLLALALPISAVPACGEAPLICTAADCSDSVQMTAQRVGQTSAIRRRLASAGRGGPP
jgi:hypothetical protein